MRWSTGWGLRAVVRREALLDEELKRAFPIHPLADFRAESHFFNRAHFTTAPISTTSTKAGTYHEVSALKSSVLGDAESNAVLAKAGLQACSQVWAKGSGGSLDTQRGENWAHGCMAMTLFNTIATPNAYSDEWTHCSSIGSTALADLSNADSYHPGGVNTLMLDGSVKFIKDSINWLTWWSLGTKGNGEVISASSF
jgi:prepilin-type processing-associated H-X9-DG protein